MASEREKVKRKRRQRRERVGKLKQQFREAKNKQERDRLLELILRRDLLLLQRLKREQKSEV